MDEGGPAVDIMDATAAGAMDGHVQKERVRSAVDAASAELCIFGTSGSYHRPHAHLFVLYQVTTKYMTKYERARVLGTRALQIRLFVVHTFLARVRVCV